MTDFASLPVDVPGNPTLLDMTKQLLGIEPADTSRDQELSQFLEMAGQAAERYIDNIIEQREVTEQIARRKEPVALRYWPVTGPLSVTVDGADLSGEFSTYRDDGLGWAVRSTCNLWRNCCFEQMNLTYTAGYNPLPADLAYALAQSGASYETGGTGGAVKRETVVGVGSIEYVAGDEGGAAQRVGQLPASAVAVLDTYRRKFA